MANAEVSTLVNIKPDVRLYSPCKYLIYLYFINLVIWNVSPGLPHEG